MWENLVGKEYVVWNIIREVRVRIWFRCMVVEVLLYDYFELFIYFNCVNVSIKIIFYVKKC